MIPPVINSCIQYMAVIMIRSSNLLFVVSGILKAKLLHQPLF